jgi:D-serine deaminase-like pyridoxal phosphate-dependent protein
VISCAFANEALQLPIAGPGFGFAICQLQLHFASPDRATVSIYPERDCFMDPIVSFQTKQDLDTPCLIVDQDVLEANLAYMQSVAREAGKHLRPHAKTHKCSTLAHKQIQAGAIGICAAKLSEAEALSAAGIRNILITGPIVTAAKMSRLATILERDSTLMAVLDHPEVAGRLNEVLRSRDLSMDVLLDVDVGLHRTGVVPRQASELAEHVAALSQLRLKGIQAYAGQVQHIASYAERRQQSLACMQEAAALFNHLRGRYPSCTVFSGTGTGTFDIDLLIVELTELQVGSYALMDAEYLNIGCRENSSRFTAFSPALRLLTTVLSTNQPGFVTVDAGLKSVYRDGASPIVVSSDFSGLRYAWFGDEYGRLVPDGSGRLPEIGSVIELVTSHCDPTINLFDRFYITRGDQVVDVWTIDLRGKSQ